MKRSKVRTQKMFRVIEKLKTLSLYETVGLIVAIEETFDVDTTSPAMLASPMMTADLKALLPKEEQTEFNVMLDEVPADKKIPILKVVRSLTALGLKEAKALVESAPKAVQEGIGKDAAEDAKKQLESAGAKVSLI